jgi:hypothetical protein
MKATFIITNLCLVVFFAACTPSLKIVYDVSKYQPASEQININLSIQTFEDMRHESPDNQAQLDAIKPLTTVSMFDDDAHCINAEKYYKIPVSQQMTDMFCKYLNHKAYFSDVSRDQKEYADYYVTANIKQFAGEQKFSSKAAVGQNFGLIGALATMNLKSEAKIVIELSDICLYDNAGNLLAEIGDFKKEYEGDYPVNANCYCIYGNVNQSLAEFYEELGTILFQEVKRAI